MKKRVLGVAFGAALIFGGSFAFSTTEEVAAQQIIAIDSIGGGSDKGDLYGNSSGTKYCCKASDYKECGASACP